MLMIGLSMVRCACGAPGGAHAYPDRGFDSDLREAGLADAGLAFEEHEPKSTADKCARLYRASTLVALRTGRETYETAALPLSYLGADPE